MDSENTENKNSVFPDATIRSIEGDYNEFKVRYKAFCFKREHDTFKEFSYPPKYAIELAKAANIAAPFYYTSHRRFLGVFTTNIKRFIRWVSLPFIKTCLVHQQHFNNQIVGLAQAVVHLEQRLYQLEERLHRYQKKGDGPFRDSH